MIKANFFLGGINVLYLGCSSKILQVDCLGLKVLYLATIFKLADIVSGIVVYDCILHINKLKLPWRILPWRYVKILCQYLRMRYNFIDHCQVAVLI